MRCVKRDGVAHDAHELSALVEARQDHVFEFLVKGRRVGLVTDGPAGHVFDTALNPPAVQNAQAGHTVERRLHPAGAGCFERRLRRVEPHIHSGHEEARQIPIVVFE